MSVLQEDEEREPVPANQRAVRKRGLLRCCLATLIETDTPTRVRDILDCQYEAPGNKRMIVADDGVWQMRHQSAATRPDPSRRGDRA